MKFINKLTGAVLVPKGQDVIEMYSRSDSFEVYQNKSPILEDMTKMQLLANAREAGLSVKERQSKGEIIKMLAKASIDLPEEGLS